MLLHCLHALNAQSHITCDCSDASCIIACLMHSVTISLLAIVGLHPTLLCRLTGFPFTNMPRSSSSSVEPFQLRGLHSQQKLNPGNYSQWNHPKKSIIGKAKKNSKTEYFCAGNYICQTVLSTFNDFCERVCKNFPRNNPATLCLRMLQFLGYFVLAESFLNWKKEHSRLHWRGDML